MTPFQHTPVRTGPATAEVAFLVQDDHQGRGFDIAPTDISVG